MDKKNTHAAADALDWNESQELVRRLNDDGRFREAMLVSTGCNLGLRVSDMLPLRWCDLLSGNILVIREKKTDKKRTLLINAFLQKEARLCHDELEISDDNDYIFTSYRYDGSRHITRIRVHQLLKEIQAEYAVGSARNFSAHSLRKTFGRRVWEQECARGRGDQALVLLSEVFGHSSVAITKRYLGIRQEEILSVYTSLTD